MYTFEGDTIDLTDGQRDVFQEYWDNPKDTNTYMTMIAAVAGISDGSVKNVESIAIALARMSEYKDGSIDFHNERARKIQEAAMDMSSLRSEEDILSSWKTIVDLLSAN